jgi:hypothetical protein
MKGTDQRQKSLCHPLLEQLLLATGHLIRYCTTKDGGQVATSWLADAGTKTRSVAEPKFRSEKKKKSRGHTQ